MAATTTTSNSTASLAPTSAEEIAALFNLVGGSGTIAVQQQEQQQQQLQQPVLHQTTATTSQQCQLPTAEIVLSTSELADPAALQQKLSAVLAQLRGEEQFNSGASIVGGFGSGATQKIIIRTEPVVQQQQTIVTAANAISVIKPEPELQLQQLQLQQQQRRVSIVTVPNIVDQQSSIVSTSSQPMLLLNNKSIISSGVGGTGSLVLIPLDSANNFQLEQNQQQPIQQQPILIPQRLPQQQQQIKQQPLQPQLRRLVTVRPKIEQVNYSSSPSTPSQEDHSTSVISGNLTGLISGGNNNNLNNPSRISHHPIVGGGAGGINGSPWQQYIKQFTNMGPCPICGDKISGYHYGIFSCESCKGFFKRTVQNKKTYLCHRGSQSACEMSLLSRKKCPACRLRKCLDKGMRVEAIRCDRTRGGRSLYTGMRATALQSPAPSAQQQQQQQLATADSSSLPNSSTSSSFASGAAQPASLPPPLTQAALPASSAAAAAASGPLEDPDSAVSASLPACIAEALNSERAVMLEEDSLDLAETAADESAVYRALLLLAERRLYRLVRWSRHLPAFNAVSTEDQIALLQNCWIELLCFDCCWRSLQTPSEIRLTANKCINLEAARELGADSIVAEILALTGDLCRVGLTLTEYACLKVIVLMQPDAQDLSCPDKVRACLDDMCQSLMSHTVALYPNEPNKFAELFLKMADLKRTASAAWSMLAGKDLSPYLESSSLLMELFKSSRIRSGRS